MTSLYCNRCQGGAESFMLLEKDGKEYILCDECCMRFIEWLEETRRITTEELITFTVGDLTS